MAKSSIMQFKPKTDFSAPKAPTKAVDAWETEGGAVAHPTHEQISKRAYGFYLKSGRQEGRCRINWEQAEQELQDEMQKNSSVKKAAAATASDLDDE